MEFSNEVIAISKSSFLNIDYEKYVIGYEIETISKGKVIASQFDFKDIKSIKVVSGKSNWGLFFIVNLILGESGGFRTSVFPKLIIHIKQKRKEIVISDLSELEFSKLKITIKRIQKALKFYRKNLK